MRFRVASGMKIKKGKHNFVERQRGKLHGGCQNALPRSSVYTRHVAHAYVCPHVCTCVIECARD